MFEDFAGLRTLDSVVRANEIFGQKNILLFRKNFTTNGLYI
jgi:vancomycin permeability regulator SanA